MADRLAELEDRRRRVNEIRLQRKMREEGRASLIAFPENDADNTRTTMTRRELDDLLLGVGIKPALIDNQREEKPAGDYARTEFLAPAPPPIAVAAKAAAPSPIKLSIFSLSKNSVSIPTKTEKVCYSKIVQTDYVRDFDGEFSLGSQDFDDSVVDRNSSDDTSAYDVQSPAVGRKHFEKILKFDNLADKCDGAAADDSTLTEVMTMAPALPLSEEEKAKILKDDDFLRFVKRQSIIFERIIADEVDIFADYTGAAPISDKVDSGELLMLSREVYDDATSGSRMVRALDYSTHFPELLAVAYDHNDNQPLAPEGVVNVWNTRFKTSPEMSFHSSSRITSMIFDEFQSNIIIGGCYSGQICIWDTRANKRNPVCRTQLSVKGHTQPILCMQMVGSQNAHDLVTVSTDGRLCTWTVDNLSAPINFTNLQYEQNTIKKTATVLSMSFFHSNVNDFVIGSEENCLFIGDRHAHDGGISRKIPAHGLPVSSVDLHPLPGGTNDFSSLCLSGSMDFGVKLWDLKDPNPERVVLLNIERKHKFYIVDVKWSPVHPAVFVSASADGTLHLWNLNANIESSIATVDTGGAIRRVRWTRNGKQLAVGGFGRVLLYDVNESLYNVRPNEFDDFSSVLLELKASCNEHLTAAA